MGFVNGGMQIVGNITLANWNDGNHYLNFNNNYLFNLGYLLEGGGETGATMYVSYDPFINPDTMTWFQIWNYGDQLSDGYQIIAPTFSPIGATHFSLQPSDANTNISLFAIPILSPSQVVLRGS